ncbi:conserved hypothetical protein [Culex quinquefasciatus]|uniref:Chitin-binding type-2 domain-containing protein n=1 Tax=Culex quinquefasciatus TaxID=7176 RepID=B0WLF8_CULQU|nr:conserved hypothetical protein [Culex quinquefasciatus]|eukprot:XP_001849542.1 conserved hypothetical protein [Culex quinquefasciatus]
MLPYLLLVLLASTAAERDPRCARYTRGAQARTLPHDTDCTKFYMCDIQGNALEMKCPKNTFFSVDSGICTFDDSACSGGERAPVVKPMLPIINKVPTRPKPDHPVIPPQAPILPMPGLPVLPPQAPILPTPELPVIPPQAPILPMPELPVIPTDPPKDTISGPIFMPYSAPRLVQDSRCSDRSALNSSIMLPAVGDCTKFVVCVGSMAYEKQCPVGQHWSTERNYCDFIDRAKCLA